jgi:hypothetical protein
MVRGIGNVTAGLCVGLGLWLGQAAAVQGQEWGSLSGTFLYGGDPPTPAKLTPTKDVEYCGKFDLVDEKIIVNPENKGLANVVITLNPARGVKVPVHPDYESSAAGEVVMKNDGCRFEPRVALVRTTQTLVIANPDAVAHNSKLDCLANNGRNPIIPAGQNVKEKFTKEERLPVNVSCSIHPWMSGRVVIKEHPYMAVTDKDGNFTIANLPAGTWEFQIWHESPGYVQDVSVDGKKTKWSRGRVEVEIKPGDNKLGTIEMPAASFK